MLSKRPIQRQWRPASVSARVCSFTDNISDVKFLILSERSYTLRCGENHCPTWRIVHSWISLDTPLGLSYCFREHPDRQHSYRVSLPTGDRISDNRETDGIS